MEARWTPEKAWHWYKRQGWIVGCNFIPSNAINQLEMWQPDTFDQEKIHLELGWTCGLGFNAVRVYLHDLLWKADTIGFKERIERYLDIAYGYGIRTIFVFFDDCWNKEGSLGPQPAPIPGIHNSGWVQSPGIKIVQGYTPEKYGYLEEYVRDILGTYDGDERVLLWDLYNEPGKHQLVNGNPGLLEHVCNWGREVDPAQPMSVGIWSGNERLNAFQIAFSDIITFHNYKDAEALRLQIDELERHGRPLICTEYMARPAGSRFQTHLPIFKEAGMGCFNWGLVKGKSQTIYPWESPPGATEPELWFHDILQPDGNPFSEEEADLIRSLTMK